MERRQFQRYGAELLRENLTEVLLVLPDKLEIEARVVDVSSQGIKVSIPPSVVTLSIPRKMETVAITFPANKLQITCRCMYSMYNQDGSMLMGFYVFDPDGQNTLRIILDTIL